MATDFLYPINLNGLEIQNVTFQVLGTDPASPVQGQFWFNSASSQFKYYDGTTTHILSMTYLLARANHTGTQTASTISDFDAQVRTSRLDQMAAPTADVSLNSHKLTNVTTPSASSDAATKGYVDSVASGLSWKDAARAATTADITLSGAQTIDGVSVVAGDRVLVMAQTSGADNGIYVAAAGAWSRAADADTSAEVKAGMALYVNEGTTNGNAAFVLTTDDPITLGTTALTFAQLSAGGTSYSADESTLHLAGTTFSINSSYVAPIANGGTNATTAAGARTNLAALTSYAADIGDGSTTDIVVTHNLGTRDVICAIYATGSPYGEVGVKIDHTSTNTVTAHFATAPASGAYRIVIHARA